MALYVNTNIASLNAQRSMANSTKALSKALERLSSGLRINSSADDAAGLAIADGMESQIRGLNQAGRNANDGLSMIGTAEGAINQASTILQRIRELAVQAANDINSNDNRAAIQQEITAQVSELTRIGNSVQFNGQTLLDGSFSNKQIQVGANASQSISISISDFRAQSIGKIATTTSTNAVATGTAIDSALGNLQINGITIGTSTNAMDTLSFAQNNGSVIAKAAAVNASFVQTGVSASINATTYGGAGATVAAIGGAGAGVSSGAADSLVINGVTIYTGAGATGLNNVLTNDSNNVAMNAINAKSVQTGIVASHSGAGAATRMLLTAADGRNITIVSAGSTAVAGFAVANTTVGAKLTLTSSKDFTVTSGGATDLVGLGAGTTTTFNVNPNSAVSYIDVSNAANAGTAIQIVDSALSQVNTSRAGLGAISNRLENTISNLQTIVENLSASQSRIRDADFATETANMTRAQILQQAGTAVLSQANVAPQAALSLLK